MLRSLLFSFFLISGFSFLSNAQIGTGQWRMHNANSKAIDVAAGNGMVMAALNTGVLSYDVAAEEYHEYNNMNGLSDINVSCIVYHPSTNSFLIGYELGNIDQILSNGTIVNIPGIFLSETLGSKRINAMDPYQNFVYVSTGFGVVVVDPVKHEIKDTYYPGASSEPVLDVSVLHDTLFALTETTCYKGAMSNNFLADAGQWNADSRIPAPVAGTYAKIGVQQDELHVLYKKNGPGADTLFRVSNSGLVTQLGDDYDFEIMDFRVINDNFMLILDYGLFGYDENSVNVLTALQYDQQFGAQRAICELNGVYWIADNKFGLVKFNNQFDYAFVSTLGPPKNEFFSMNSFEDKLVVTSGVLDRTAFSYRRSGAYTFEDESWKLYEQESQDAWSNGYVWDISSAAINPTNKEQFALGSYAIDGISIVNGSEVTAVYTGTNSGLENTNLGNSNVCVTALEYDEFGNLWVANGYTNEPLKVLLADGTWRTFNTGSLTSSKFTTKLAIDYNNNKWMGVYGVGVVGFNDNETPGVTTDDSYKILQTGEGNGNLPSDAITAIAVDFDNEIWIGTENGFVVLYSSDGLFDASGVIDATRLLVNYEGNVEELLGDTPISDIEIDGGNRKWISTSSAGIFLLTADGQEVISVFTKENSPLISNNILDMEFNHTTGELFIITDLGLVSMRTDASYEDPEYATTTVFPNPVKPEYEGPITIQGIRYDSDVKITDIAGNLVYQTTSNGGTATWNGKTLSGADVAGGVYMIWTATNTGKNKKVGKVTVVR